MSSNARLYAVNGYFMIINFLIAILKISIIYDVGILIGDKFIIFMRG